MFLTSNGRMILLFPSFTRQYASGDITLNWLSQFLEIELRSTQVRMLGPVCHAAWDDMFQRIASNAFVTKQINVTIYFMFSTQRTSYLQIHYWWTPVDSVIFF